MEDCLFCKIAKKELPAEIIYEDEKMIVFKDINPKAQIHFLIVPKRHIESVASLALNDKELMGDLVMTAQKIGQQENLESYNLQINVGRKAGQLIDRLHLHLLSAK